MRVVQIARGDITNCTSASENRQASFASKLVHCNIRAAGRSAFFHWVNGIDGNCPMMKAINKE